jgi:hypothetical protein
VVLFGQVRGAIAEVQRREWALLCLETIGVLVGILIAFQLNEWAENRRETARNRELVERLFDEAQRNVSWLRNQRDENDAIISREVKFATALLHDGQCPANEDLWKSVYTVGWFPPIVVENSVYDEMMGAGGLTAIENSSARRAVSRFQSELTMMKDRAAFIRLNSGPAVPIDDPNSNVSYDPTRDDPEDITYNHAALCRDAAFKKRVADKVRDHQFVLSQRGELVRSAIEVCSSLGRIVGKKCTPFRGGPLTGQDARYAEDAWKEAGQR